MAEKNQTEVATVVTPLPEEAEPEKLAKHYRGVVPPGAFVNGVETDERAAPKLDPGDKTGARGIRLQNPEVGGGEMAEVLEVPFEDPQSINPASRMERVLKARFAQKIAPFAGRPISEWGVLHEGDTVRGHMILVDLDSGEKVRAFDGAKVPKGRVFANSRNFPADLMSDAALEVIR